MDRRRLRNHSRSKEGWALKPYGFDTGRKETGQKQHIPIDRLIRCEVRRLKAAAVVARISVLKLEVVKRN